MAEKYSYKPRFALRWDRYYGQGIYLLLLKKVHTEASQDSDWIRRCEFYCVGGACGGVCGCGGVETESGVERIEIFVGDADAREDAPQNESYRTYVQIFRSFYLLSLLLSLLHVKFRRKIRRRPSISLVFSKIMLSPEQQCF